MDHSPTTEVIVIVTATETPPFDTARAETFGQKMAGVLNAAGVALMTSIGHRTGLFDTMAELPPADSRRIAEAAGLSERYVREWLGAMVTGGVVEHDPAVGTFRLSPEHAACLTRAARPNNAAVGFQFLAVLGAAEDQVVAAFRHGKGVPYSAYPRFHEVMAEESDQTTTAGLEDHILPLVPGLPDRLARGIDVLDIGCGSGYALVRLAELYPASRFVGYDFSPEAIRAGQDAACRDGLGNVRFAVRDAAAMTDAGRYDLVTAFDAVHDQADPAGVLRNVRRAMRPGGAFLMQDIRACSHLGGNRDHPLGPWLYTISCMHCMSVSLAAGGPGLGAVWGKELALEMLADAGFGNVTVHALPHDPLNDYYVCRPG
ncbi:MAG: methyltransferase domain-containing protein [Gemmataceae bacterium]|nr:methyltransferase domain-containing protein [Gemmataceae bacterium]